MLPLASVNPFAPGRECELGNGIQGSLFESACRGSKRGRDGGGGVDLPENSQKRLCSGTVTYQEVLADFQLDLLNAEKYTFESLKTYVLQPEDDLSEMIKLHGKIALDPDNEYEIKTSFTILNGCYIIGNGAKIKISCPVAYPINVWRYRYLPRVNGMWGVTFCNVVFERSREFPGGLFNISKCVNFYGCHFNGFLGTTIHTESDIVVRGCHFTACFKCINSSALTGQGRYPLVVENCIFEKCMIGIMAKGKVKITGNSAFGTYCFAHIRGEGKIVGNVVGNPYQLANTVGIEMLTCYGEKIQPLCSIHIVNSKTFLWPVFKNNNLMRARLYIGERKGVFEPKNCQFSFSQIYLDAKTIGKVSLHSVFAGTCAVFKMLPSETSHERQRACICALTHTEPVLKCVDVTPFALPNPYVVSVESGQYSSDEEE